VTTSMTQLLEAYPLMNGLSSDAIALVAGCARNVAFEPGALLFAEGASADTFYLLRRGHAAIEVHEPGRGQLVIETIGPGEVVGWSWLIEPYRWTFDARAQDSLGAIAIDGACLRAKSLDDPAFGYALLQRVAGQILARLQATRMRLLDLCGEANER